MMPTTAAPTLAPKPTRAAAVAGVVFSVLMGVSLAIVGLAVPANQTDPGVRLDDVVASAAFSGALVEAELLDDSRQG